MTKQTYTILEVAGQCPKDEPLQDSQAAESFIYERGRQRYAKGFSNKHDDQHTDGALALAAAAFAIAYAAQSDPNTYDDLMELANEAWPWDPNEFNPRMNGPKNVIRAGALLIAEWQRRARRAVEKSSENE